MLQFRLISEWEILGLVEHQAEGLLGDRGGGGGDGGGGEGGGRVWEEEVVVLIGRG